MRSDNGTDFKNTQIEEFLDEEGSSMSFQLHTPLNKIV
jgi:hypothetical protein